MRITHFPRITYRERNASRMQRTTRRFGHPRFEGFETIQTVGGSKACGGVIAC